MQPAFRAFLAVLLLVWSPFIAAQGADGKPIRFIVPYPPGGGGDTLSRLIARKLAESIAVPVIVDNRAGAGGIIGTDLAAKAPPDGLTLVLGTPSPITVAPYLQKQMPYDPQKDLAPITLVTVIPAVVLVNPSSPVKTLSQLLELARAKPGTVTYSSSGSCGTGCLSGLMLETMGKVSMLHVPYKGNSPAVMAVMSGEVNLAISELITALPLIRDGRLRAVAVTGERRSPVLPDLPTVGETLPGYASGPFYGILTSGGTPAEIVARRRDQIVNVLRDPELRNTLLSQGGEVIGSTPAEFAALIKAETARWGLVLKNANIPVN